MEATPSLVVMLLQSVGNVTVWGLESHVSLVVEKHIQLLARNRTTVVQPVISSDSLLLVRRRFIFISRKIKRVLTHDVEKM